MRFFFLLCFFVAVQVSAAPSYVSKHTWQKISPYLMPEDHPLKAKLDKIFSKQRVLKNVETLVAAGFEKRKPQPKTKVIVTKHKEMKGYIFKIYTDDLLSFYRNEPEYIAWIARAEGARLIKAEIERMGWQSLFKAPKKWIYALPEKPKAKRGHVQKNFILVEEDMQIIPDPESRKKWKDGSMTTEHLDKIYYLVTKVGLRGGCKYNNIPICKDGRIAFIDTQNHTKWPIRYDKFLRVLEGGMRAHWETLVP